MVGCDSRKKKNQKKQNKENTTKGNEGDEETTPEEEGSEEAVGEEEVSEGEDQIESALAALQKLPNSWSGFHLLAHAREEIKEKNCRGVIRTI